MSSLNKRLSKQSIRRWFETPSCSLWRHCNGTCAWIHHVNSFYSVFCDCCHHHNHRCHHHHHITITTIIIIKSIVNLSEGTGVDLSRSIADPLNVNNLPDHSYTLRLVVNKRLCWHLLNNNLLTFYAFINTFYVLSVKCRHMEKLSHYWTCVRGIYRNVFTITYSTYTIIRFDHVKHMKPRLMLSGVLFELELMAPSSQFQS